MSALEVVPIRRWSLVWRVGVAVAGIALLLNGVQMSDRVWPFGPMSQYAFTPKNGDTIVITRVEGALADGRRIDLPLRVSVSGISRAEIEARKDDIVRDPSLLRSVVDGWSSRHPDQPPVQEVWLVQDTTTLVDGQSVGQTLVPLAEWRVAR